MLSNIFALSLISVPYVLIEKYFRAKLFTRKINYLNLAIIFIMLIIVYPAILMGSLKILVIAKVLQHLFLIIISLILLLSKEY
jgi:hypothetical protein